MINSNVSSVIVFVTKSQLFVLFPPPVECNPKSPIGHFSDTSLHFLMSWGAKECHLLILLESSFHLSLKDVPHNGTQSIHGCTLWIMMMNSFRSGNRKNVLEGILENFISHHFLKSIQTIIKLSIDLIMALQSRHAISQSLQIVGSGPIVMSCSSLLSSLGPLHPFRYGPPPSDSHLMLHKFDLFDFEQFPMIDYFLPAIE